MLINALYLYNKMYSIKTKSKKQTVNNPPKTISPSANPVDHYIQIELDKQKLSSAPQATPDNLVRRAYYDLLGLPPTPDQIEQFEREYLTLQITRFDGNISRDFSQ